MAFDRPPSGSWRRGRAEAIARRRVAPTLVLSLLTLSLAAPAAAQVGASLSAASDYRFRGVSLSNGRPTLSLDLSRDDPSGLYMGASATVAGAHAGPQLLELQEYVGYVRRTRGPWAIDAGLTNSDYARYDERLPSIAYQEAYVGLVGRRLAYHLHYSPNYFGQPYGTLYSEVDGTIRTANDLRLSGHLGLLAPTGGRRDDKDLQYDWRLAIAAAVRGFDVQLAWTGARPDSESEAGHARRRSALVVGVSKAF
ncbi:TorF family putative porin [Phenylobacterium hankyongense]|uniref:TorF family putative porin n=1 Tax=Phenylobacterium hankyongense TaxID=1813876 RepID=UPI001403442E|nr:TorF family putative porin [Phenylobacterium hankyongense]